MSESFDFLFGDYREKAARLLDGIVVHQTNAAFSTLVMDAAYHYNRDMVSGLRDYLKEQGFEVDQIIVLNMLISNVNRDATGSMKSRSALYVVKNAEGKHNAVFFCGCDISA